MQWITAIVLLVIIFILNTITLSINRKIDKDYIYEKEVYEIFEDLQKVCKNTGLDNLTKFEQIKLCLIRSEHLTFERLNKLLKIITIEEHRIINSNHISTFIPSVLVTGLVAMVAASLSKSNINEFDFSLGVLYVLILFAVILMFLVISWTKSRRILIIKQVVKEVIDDNALNNKKSVESKSEETDLSYSKVQEEIERDSKEVV